MAFTLTENGGPSDFAPLRLQVRKWLSENLAPNWRCALRGVEDEQLVAFQKEWFARIVPTGFVTGHWGSEWPGGGRSLGEQVAIFQELARADAPRLNLHFLSLYHVAVTLHEWGSEEQKETHLPDILNGRIWCQGFSEPGAGSDLAGLTTSAVRTGDHYVINGSKIWATMGHFADWCLLLARTSKEGPKQAGLTCFLLNMRDHGVTVRPIRQITGETEFAELFLDDVRIPQSCRVGLDGEGWAVAQTTLSAERGLILVECVERLCHSAVRLINVVSPVKADTELRRDTAHLLTKIKALRALVSQAMDRRIAGHERAGDPSIIKLLFAATLREFTELGLRTQGLRGQIQEPFERGVGQETGNWMFDFLNSYMWTIAGGTNEIHRNITAEKVLGLPREPSTRREP